ncbi:MAG TPA: energy transducer TonB, partial [Nitrospinota bacterium]|nr:energy transducer TonB [Nitrospinota bacterium]
GVGASIAIHAGFMVIVPPPEPQAVMRTPLHVVELRRMQIPLPNPPSIPRERPGRETEVGSPPPLLPPPPAAAPPAAALGLEEMVRAARSPVFEAPLPLPSAITFADRSGKTPVVAPRPLSRAKLPRGTPGGSRLGGRFKIPAVRSGAKGRRSDGLRSLQRQLIRQELLKASKAEPEDLEIRGPVAKRELVYRPPPPTPLRGAEGEIKLKFWVLPDGTVGRIVLLVRGDSSLETTAIRNLKRWKFNTLPRGARVPEQWGTMRFRFLSAAANSPFSSGARVLKPEVLRERPLR